MRKSFFIILSLGITLPTKAQLAVTSTGVVKVGNPSSLPARFNVKGTPNGINSYVTSTSGSSTVAVYGFAEHIGSETSTGLYGRASGYSSLGANFGVQGEAFGGKSGCNYGVFGHVISSENGAAIYGSSHTSCVGHTVDGSYAGYFEGNVKVTGSINGVVLGSATTSSSTIGMLSEQAICSGSMTSQLKGLNASSFYLDIPQQEVKESLTVAQVNPALARTENFNLTERQVISKQHYALDAEQLEESFPDLVYENEDGTKSINYVEMVPILVQAINELGAKIEQMDSGDVMMAKQSVTAIEETTESMQVLSMGQNKPNPFSTATSVEVTIAEDVQSAFVYVYDLTGKKVQQVDINARGKQTIQLSSTGLDEGMYFYSLIADGKVVQTRRMIIEK